MKRNAQIYDPPLQRVLDELAPARSEWRQPVFRLEWRLVLRVSAEGVAAQEPRFHDFAVQHLARSRCRADRQPARPGRGISHSMARVPAHTQRACPTRPQGPSAAPSQTALSCSDWPEKRTSLTPFPHTEVGTGPGAVSHPLTERISVPARFGLPCRGWHPVRSTRPPLPGPPPAPSGRSGAGRSPPRGGSLPGAPGNLLLRATGRLSRRALLQLIVGEGNFKAEAIRSTLVTGAARLDGFGWR